MKKVLSIGLIGLIVFSTLSVLGTRPVSAATTDYVVFSQFDPGLGPIWACGGYVEYYGVPEWGDEIQYVYFVKGTMGYKYKVWVTNEGSPSDPTPYIDIRQHPSSPYPSHVGPVEPRHFEYVSSANLAPHSANLDVEEFFVDSTGVYLGPNVGIHKWDHDWNYVGQIGPAFGGGFSCQSLAYNAKDNIWYTATYDRRLYQLSDTDDDGNLMDESWQYVFTYPDYGGSHHDGMEYVGGYLWISDMTIAVIGKWQYNSGTHTWTEVGRYTYPYVNYVEGMGFGPNDHFWMTSGFPGGGGAIFYEVGDEITMYYPIADAGEDVQAHPPTIPVKFDGSGSHHTDPSRKIVLYEWDFDGDGVYDYSSTEPVAEHAYPAYYKPDGSIDWDTTAKTYTVYLKVTDDDPVTPKSDVDNCNVHITAPPWKPVADPDGPYEGNKGTLVQLDGSNSYDPESKMFPSDHPWYETIATYEWDLDHDGQFDDAIGAKPTHTWDTEGLYIIGLKVTDSQPSGPGSTIGPLDVDIKYTTVVMKKAEEWSFSIITDLHIGRGYPDYGGGGWNDAGTSGQNYYLTERLSNTVKWIKDNRVRYNIKFVVVLGDIADSGEYSELEKAKSILDDLDKSGVPYVPVIGNHDVWPHTEDEEADYPESDRHFREIFIEERLGVLTDYFDDWDSPLIMEEVEWGVGPWKKEWTAYLQNYAFSYNGIKFVALDCVAREPFPLGKGVGGDAVLWDGTLTWLTENLHTDQPTVIFSHHPFIDDMFVAFSPFEMVTIDEAIEISKAKVLANFAGHIHGYYDPAKIFNPRSFDSKRELLDSGLAAIVKAISSPIFVNANNNYAEEGFTTPAGIPVVTTEAMMVGSNEPTPKGIIRIVKVKGEEIDFNTIDGEFRALNPYFAEVDIEDPPLGRKISVEFEVYAFTKHSGEYIVDFGDGTTSEPKATTGKKVEFKHDYPSVKGGKHYDVTLKVKSQTPEGEIMETITQQIYVPPPWGLGMFGLSPVDIVVTDPDGLIVSKQLNGIPGAIYTEQTDFNGDGDPDDIILIQDRKIGDYFITVIPEPDAAPTDTYTLLIWPETEDEPCVLAENVPISDVPTQPYIFELTESGKFYVWQYIFKDSYGRGTALKINTAYKFFKFIAPGKDYGIRKATYMRLCGRAIIINHCDSQLRLITAAVDTKIDFCYAVAWDVQARKFYYLLDKPGIEK
jgi:predicted MPP superfamily phosphohydrolase